MKKALLLAWVLFASYTAFCQSPAVYLNSDYSGDSMSLAASYPNLAGSHCQVTWHRRILSVRIPEGWQVELFAGADFSGATISLTADVPDLSTLEWEGKTASIRVSHTTAIKNGICPCLKAKPIK
jgi:hypothetical protein